MMIFLLFTCFLPVLHCFTIGALGTNSSDKEFSISDDVPLENFTNLKIDDLSYLDIPEFTFVRNQKVCQINLYNLPQKQPLLLNSQSKQILLPDAGSSIITINSGDYFKIACLGSDIMVDGTSIDLEIADVKCVSGNTVSIEGSSVDVSTVVCFRRVASVAIPTGKKCFGGLGDEIDVGFEFPDNHFIKEMTTCFNPITKGVYNSSFVLSHQIGYQNKGGTEPGWKEEYFNLAEKLNELYHKDTQRATINKLLGIVDPTCTKYIEDKGNYYLSKGHLTARADFMYYAQQDATFHYINSAPQWMTLNALNWRSLEIIVRHYAAIKILDLTVMTGTYGITTLPHETTGSPVELYLFVSKKGEKAIPVPELFWKILYSPSNRRGVAILGINNPYQADIQKSIICPDIANQLNWLGFDRTNNQRGYIYACTIPELRKVIPQIPNFDVIGILD